uniref:Lipase-like protein n=1 Tax=Leersia perrieri TaxID=77586 RepID=A0A0D9VVJ2_9ORYZ
MIPVPIPFPTYHLASFALAPWLRSHSPPNGFVSTSSSSLFLSFLFFSPLLPTPLRLHPSQTPHFSSSSQYASLLSGLRLPHLLLHHAGRSLLLALAAIHFGIEAMEKERKQGFFAALKGEVVRGLSPARSRGKTPAPRGASPARMLIPRSRKTPPPPPPPEQIGPEQLLVPRSGSLRPGGGEVLAPLIEGPDMVDGDAAVREESGRRDVFGQWVRGHLSRTPSTAGSGGGGGGGSFRRSDLRLLLGVMGAPLAPVPSSAAEALPLLSVKGTPIESSSAQYILQQYVAASGGAKLLRSARNAYAMGKVRMVASEFETATRVVKNRGGNAGAAAASAVEQGGFVLWRMAPDMWYVELAVGGSKVHAGCNGRLVWRHTPWLGAHAAKGPVRPLRRALQGLDPLTTAGMFAEARCVGEKKVKGEDCFILKLSADAETLRQRSEGPAEIIRHVLFGYFSQRTGLLVHVEDSHLTRIQPHAGGDAVYWETTISSFLDDYRPVEGGVMIAHAGRSAVTLFRFGEMAMSHTKTRMEEAWTIDEAAFNVPGLSADCFIPPADIRCPVAGEACELPPRAKAGAVHPARVAAVHHPRVRSNAAGDGDKIVWRVQV